MYLVKRISKGAMMRVVVAQPQGTDAGLNSGGSFEFDSPEVEGGISEHQMGEYAARVIMSDPGHTEHFTCTPDLPDVTPVEEPTAQAQAEESAAQTDQPAAGTKRTRKATGGGDTGNGN